MKKLLILSILSLFSCHFGYGMDDESTRILDVADSSSQFDPELGLVPANLDTATLTLVERTLLARTHTIQQMQQAESRSATRERWIYGAIVFVWFGSEIILDRIIPWMNGG